MQLDVVFELARLSDRPADADGLMRPVRHQLEYLASGVRAAAYAASEGGNWLQRLHLIQVCQPLFSCIQNVPMLNVTTHLIVQNRIDSRVKHVD